MARRSNRPSISSTRSKLVAAFALALAAVAAAPVASAQPATPEKKPEGDAFAAFLEGQRAFEHGDYLEAGKAFEAAYRISPHADVSWNAARAWERAGEHARAANTYARYLDEAPPMARDRDSAIQAIARLATRLGRIDVVATGLTDVRVDDAPLRGARVYVTPGAHVVRAAAGERQVVRTATVAAGEATSVALVDEPPPPVDKASAPVAPVVVIEPKEPPPPVLNGWQSAVVGVGFGLTAISAAVLVWSGVDTLQARSAFDHSATPQGLEDGRAKQTRTNVLVGTTTALGALSTGATLIFALTGHREVQARVGAIPSPVSLAPAFTLAGSF